MPNKEIIGISDSTPFFLQKKYIYYVYTENTIRNMWIEHKSYELFNDLIRLPN